MSSFEMLVEAQSRRTPGISAERLCSFQPLQKSRRPKTWEGRSEQQSSFLRKGSQVSLELTGGEVRQAGGEAPLTAKSRPRP